MAALQVDSSGNLKVNIQAGAGSGGTAIADEAAFTFGTTQGTPAMGVFQTTATSNPLTTGQVGVQQMTANRASHINVRQSNGTELGTIGSPFYTALTNGTTVPGIKAASTAAVAADPALVVAVSPNNTIPVSGTFWQTTQPISGTVTANQGGAPWTMKPDGTSWTLTGTSANVDVTNTVAVSGTFWQATQPVSGTITANQGGTWNITNISGTISLPTGAATSANQPTAAALASTTSGQTGNLDLAAVTTGAPSYTTGTTNALSLNTSGGLRVDGSGVTQPVSGTFWQATQPVSGTVTANQGGTWTVQPGNTANTTAWLVTGTGGTFPATQSGTWNITNISGTISLPTGAATSANQPTAASQGSTTSGQSGNLMMGAVTTASPTYTTAQTSPLSLDTTGALRVNVTAGSGGGGTASSFGSAFPATGTAAGGEYLSSPPSLTSGNMCAFQMNVSGALKVDGSAVTQPVSGTFWQATQPVSGTFWQATQPVSIAAAVTVSQATAANLNATVTGTIAATQSGTWTARIVGNGGATLDAAIGAATAPTNMQAVGAVYNTARPSLTTGQSAALQFDSTAGLIVNGSQYTQPVSGTGTFSVVQGTAANLLCTASQGGTWNMRTQDGSGNAIGSTSGNLNVQVNNSGAIQVSQGTIPWQIAGNVGVGTSVAGTNPLYLGGAVVTANPTAGTAGTNQALMVDKVGKLITNGAIRSLKGRTVTTLTTTANSAITSTGAAGEFIDLYGLILTNTSATSVTITITDGTTTIMTVACPAGDTRGFMLPVDSAIPMTTAANNWTGQLSAGVSSVSVTCLWVRNT
jgi:hypothetical protein